MSLDLTAEREVRASVEITFGCRQTGAETYADLAVASLRRAELNGVDVTPAFSAPERRLPLGPLGVRNQLVVESETPIEAGGGPVIRLPDPLDESEYALVYLYPSSAPELFCCFDQADLPGSFVFEVTAPDGWECIANSPVAERPAAGAAGLWRFTPVISMKPFELTLCAGPYVKVDDRQDSRSDGSVLPVRTWCRRSLAGSARLERATDVTLRSIAHYETLLDLPAPCDEYNVVLAPGLTPTAAQFPALMLVNENLLHRIPDGDDDFVATVIAHEVAHLWFGCFVDCQWWDDLWLAEAIATYLSYSAGESALGQASPWAEFAMQGKADAYRADTLPSTLSVASDIETADVALTRPPALTYSKGASVLRQLGALIGEQALHSAMHEYLTAFAHEAAELGDFLACCATAARRPLTEWAGAWLRAPGVNLLRPELVATPGATISSFEIVQSPGLVGDVLRTHRIAIGLYERSGDRLELRNTVAVELAGARHTPVPELVGLQAPDAIVVNQGDLTFARLRFDERSWKSLSDCALHLDDALTEAVCWNAAWDMTTSGEIGVDEFVSLVLRRIGRQPLPAGPGQLLSRALHAAEYYAPPPWRARLRSAIAGAALAAAQRAVPGGRDQSQLAIRFAAAAEEAGQLIMLQSWLAAESLPRGLDLGLDLRRQALETLAARDIVTDAELDRFARDDPAGGADTGATCSALRPRAAAKEAAWVSALAEGQPMRLARAHARGVWVPGQEELLAPYRRRFFEEALPALCRVEPVRAQRIARLLYPSTLADPVTVAATGAALAAGPGGVPAHLRLVLVEQSAILDEIIHARSLAIRGE